MNRPIDNDYLYPDEKSDGTIIAHLDHEAYIEALEKYVDHLEQMNSSGDIQNVSDQREMLIGFYQYLERSHMIKGDFDVNCVVKWFNPNNFIQKAESI